MQYSLTAHAKERMKERNISRELLEKSLRSPTKVLYDDVVADRLMIKKLYIKNRRERLLIIVSEVTRDGLKIITLIDTSKVRKYL